MLMCLWLTDNLITHENTDTSLRDLKLFLLSWLRNVTLGSFLRKSSNVITKYMNEATYRCLTYNNSEKGK